MGFGCSVTLREGLIVACVAIAAPSFCAAQVATQPPSRSDSSRPADSSTAKTETAPIGAVANPIPTPTTTEASNAVPSSATTGISTASPSSSQGSRAIGIEVDDQTIRLLQPGSSGQPELVGSLRLPLKPAGQLIISGAKGRALYVLFAGEGIAVLDVRVPKDPYVAWTLEKDTSVLGMTHVDDKLFVRTRDGLVAYDVTDPLRPQGPMVQAVAPLRTLAAPGGQWSPVIQAWRQVYLRSGQVVVGTIISLEPSENTLKLSVDGKVTAIPLTMVVRIVPISGLDQPAQREVGAVPSKQNMASDPSSPISASNSRPLPELPTASPVTKLPRSGGLLGLGITGLALGVAFGLGALGVLLDTNLTYVTSGRPRSYTAAQALAGASGVFVLMGAGGLIAWGASGSR